MKLKKFIILKKGETKRVVRERKYLKYGFIIRDEYWLTFLDDKPKGHAILMRKQAYKSLEEARQAAINFAEYVS